MTLQYINLLTFLWLAVWAYVAMRRLAAGFRQSILFAFPVHFVFCGLPLLFDVVVGIPEYRSLPGFHAAANDATTCLLYCLCVSLCPVLWWFSAPKSKADKVRKSPLAAPTRSGRLEFQALLLVLMVLPPILALASPDRSMYTSYTPFYRGYALGDVSRFHALVAHATKLAVVASGVLVYRAKRPAACLLTLAPLLVLNSWLHGKRNIVALSLLVLVYALWKRGVLTGKRLFIGGMVGALLLISFSTFYQTRLRYAPEFSEKRTLTLWFENFRIDFGRDDVIKLAIFDELYPDEIGILDYKGQSVVFIATVWIPRQLWPDKPANYAAHMMTAALNGPAPGGGRMTTTVLAEAVSNCGWFGFIVGPLLVALVCRIGHGYDDEIIHHLTLLVMLGLLTVSCSYWAVLALLWLGLLCYRTYSIGTRPVTSRKVPCPRISGLT